LNGSGSQLLVASHQLSDSSVTTNVAGRLPGGAQSTATRGDGAFGDVLSARINRPAADIQSSLSTARRGKNSAAGKLGDEKQIAEDRIPAVTAVASEILPARIFILPVQVDSHLSERSSVEAPGVGEAPALNTVAPQAPVSSVPNSIAATQGAFGGASPIRVKDATTVADPSNAQAGLSSEQSPFSTDLFADVIAVAQDQKTGQLVAAETAGLGSVAPKVTSRGTLLPDATQRGMEHSSAQDPGQASENPVATEPGPLDAVDAEIPTQAREAWVGHPYTEVLAKLRETTSHTARAVLQDSSVASDLNSEGTSQVGEDPARSREAVHPHPYAQPPNPITSTQPEMPAPQFMIGDSLAQKTADLTRPAHPIAIRDGQQDTDTSSGMVLPLAGHSAAGFASRGDRLQAVSEAAPSSPAENAQAVPTVIQSAQVLERMGKAEIRLGLNSSNFGSIELHTSVNQERVGATISTSHAELRTAMIAEMPSLEHAIAQHQMRLDSFQFDSRSGSQGGDTGASGGNQSGSRGGTQSANRISELKEDSAAQEVPLPQAWTASHSGLNVHA
jgi:flagellar hook-length control protein FliK